MNERKYIRNIQKIVIGLSGLIFILLVFLWVNASVSSEWRNHQDNYIHLAERISDSLGLDDVSLPEKGIYHYDLTHFGRVDRCISCHLGLENPLMKNAPQPHTTHPGNFLEDHPVDDFGCTICHGGQGRAMNKKDAFGLDEDTHWEKPLLYQPYIQATCGKCHLAVFDEMENFTGTETFRHGQEIFSDEGCLGCHKARGVGGIIGPDLTEQGEKTKHEYNFQNVKGEQTVSNWLKEHFRDPEMISPGSQMLKIDLPEEELDALATFVMGLSKPDIPLDYFSIEMLEEFKGMRQVLEGDEVYFYTCSGCHGKNGGGKDYEEFKTGVPSIMNNDFLRLVSPSFIHFTLLKGRSQKQMAAWSPDLSGFTNDEIKGITDYVKDRQSRLWAFPLENARSGDLLSGREIYNNNCASCHGEEGRGGLAVAINQEDFLGRASDFFILQTLYHGRGNTAMPAWPGFDEHEIRNLFTYIRAWHNGPEESRDFNFSEANIKEGEILYHYNCSRCHGVNGEGNTGPAIINREFLTAASDYYLLNTIAEGRIHTSMFGWSSDLNKQERLVINDIANIIAFMKDKASAPPDYVYTGSNPGDKSRGNKLYQNHCAECHGSSGEGINAPGLSNQEFLSAASNGYMLATITIGRDETRMPDWGYVNEEYPFLPVKDREDIVAFIRTWQRIQIRF